MGLATLIFGVVLFVGMIFLMMYEINKDVEKMLKD